MNRRSDRLNSHPERKQESISKEPNPKHRRHQRLLRKGQDDPEPPQIRTRPSRPKLSSTNTESRKLKYNSSSPSLHVNDWLNDLSNQDWPNNPVDTFQVDNMNPHRLAEKRSSVSLRRKRSDSSIAASATPSDQKSRHGKSAAYAQKGYQMLLGRKGVFLDSELRISDEDERLCQNLLKTECHIPNDTLLRDDLYRETIAELQDRNKFRVIQDLGRIFVPSVQTLAKISDKRFGVFVESVNEGWDSCYPLLNPHPQPDYAVGFGRSGISESRIAKLQPLIRDDPTFPSDLTSTYYMYFPFFTTEVTCGSVALDIADLQNAHSMGIAVRAILTIFRLAGREIELHNKIVAYSVSHDHRLARLNGWGPVIDGDYFTVRSILVQSLDIAAPKGLERWTPRRFSFGVYEYGLTLLDWIHTIIDELPPDLNIGSVQPLKMGSNPGNQPQTLNRSGLFQQLETQSLLRASEIPDREPSDANQPHSTSATSTQVGKSSRQKGQT